MIKKWSINLILLAIAVVIAVLPLVWIKDTEFGGTDDKAGEMVREINEDHEPWVTSPWSPPGSETESLLFALQAALGSGVLFYCLGYLRGKHGAQGKQGAVPK